MKKYYDADFAIAVHPGEILQEILEENQISQAKLARHLKMDSAKINEICRGNRGISAEMAVLLGKTFKISPGTWLNLQKNWELSKVNPDIYKQVSAIKFRA